MEQHFFSLSSAIKQTAMMCILDIIQFFRPLLHFKPLNESQFRIMNVDVSNLVNGFWLDDFFY